MSLILSGGLILNQVGGGTGGLTEASADARYLTQASADILYLSANTPLGGGDGFTEASADARYLKLTASAQTVSGNIQVIGEISSNGLSISTAGGNSIVIQDTFGVVLGATADILLTSVNGVGTLDLGSTVPFGTTMIGDNSQTFQIRGFNWESGFGSANQVFTNIDGFNIGWRDIPVGFTEASADSKYVEKATVITVSGATTVSAGMAGYDIYMQASANIEFVATGWDAGDYVNIIAETSGGLITGSGVTINAVTSAITFGDAYTGIQIRFKDSTNAVAIGRL